MKPRGVVTLVFDDGYQVIYDQVVPLLNELNIPGVFAVPLDHEIIGRTEDRPTVAWQRWIEIGRNHEIAAHGISHRSFSSLSITELHDELATAAQALSAKTVVYPGGGVNAAVVEAAATYYQAGRGTAFGIETLPPGNRMQLKTINYTKNNFSLLKANLRALWACLTSRWLIETYHLVDDHEQEKVHTVQLQDFKRHLQFLKWLPVEIKTIAAVTSAHAP